MEGWIKEFLLLGHVRQLRGLALEGWIRKMFLTRIHEVAEELRKYIWITECFLLGLLFTKQ